jgi:hypothetical protein
MPTHLKLEELQVLADQHTAHEFTHDIEALMATVHPDPSWSYEPLGCEITTLNGVSQMYQRMFPAISASMQPQVVNMWFADDGFIGEVRINKPNSSGGMVEASQFSWCEFNGDLISGECNYMDADDMAGVAALLGESFFSLPGVKVLPPR